MASSHCWALGLTMSSYGETELLKHGLYSQIICSLDQNSANINLIVQVSLLIRTLQIKSAVLVTFLVIGIESWVLCLLRRHAASELHPQSRISCCFYASTEHLWEALCCVLPSRLLMSSSSVKVKGGSLMNWMLALRHVSYALTFQWMWQEHDSLT